MKTKIILTILLIILSFNLVCQTKNYSGEVIYEAETVYEDIDNLKIKGFSKKQRRDFIALLKNQNKLKYKLLFSKEESIFKEIKKLELSENKFNLVRISVGEGIFYVSKNTLHQKEFSGKLFLINVPQFKWKLTQESKKIGNYICYKATTSIEISTSRGKSIRKIIAWYTLQIPFNYGPKEYNGLPGLILELQQDKLLLKALKINLFSKKKLDIKKPTKGERVTLKEYDSIVKEVFYSRRRKEY